MGDFSPLITYFMVSRSFTRVRPQLPFNPFLLRFCETRREHIIYEYDVKQDKKFRKKYQVLVKEINKTNLD